jgi:hypothetical protein
VDTVLGVSMAPSAVRMVLVEGENGDGATVDEENFAVAAADGSAPASAPEQVISAILGTREGAAEAGYQLRSTGVTWTDQLAAAALWDALAARKVENVMLVSAFLAAAALAQSVGNETGYEHTALLFVEPDTATLAVVHTADGSIGDVHREVLPDDDDEAVAKVVELASGAERLDGGPEGVLVVGSGVDIPLIKPVLDAATSLPLSAPEEPDTALARGAALASANARCSPRPPRRWPTPKTRAPVRSTRIYSLRAHRPPTSLARIRWPTARSRMNNPTPSPRSATTTRPSTRGCSTSAPHRSNRPAASRSW